MCVCVCVCHILCAATAAPVSLHVPPGKGEDDWHGDPLPGSRLCHDGTALLPPLKMSHPRFAPKAPVRPFKGRKVSDLLKEATWGHEAGEGVPPLH